MWASPQQDVSQGAKFRQLCEAFGLYIPLPSHAPLEEISVE
jgi:hypothetical protein